MTYLKIANPIDYKVALYIRLSKEDEKPGESESISNQRSMLTSFAKDQSLTIIDEYVDDGISGTTFDRPSFKRMLVDIESKKVNMVITKDLSRLGRDYIQTGFYIEKYFPENGVRYISILDGVDTGIDSCANDITPFKSILNDMYAKDISSKIKSVKRNKQDLGLFIGGKAPYGYIINKEEKNKIIIDADVAPIVKHIFSEAKSGKSCRAIAQDLTLSKIPTPSEYAVSKGYKVTNISTHWADNRIREILLNEVYIGNMVQGRMKKLSYKSKKNIRLPKSEWKVVKNTHEPIIDEETFLKAAEMINIRRQTRIKTHDYLLKGLVYCHECGKKVGCSPRELAIRKSILF
ncbi:MAG: recombinase family protein [Clostridia bacterium]